MKNKNLIIIIAVVVLIIAVLLVVLLNNSNDEEVNTNVQKSLVTFGYTAGPDTKKEYYEYGTYDFTSYIEEVEGHELLKITDCSDVEITDLSKFVVDEDYEYICFEYTPYQE